MLQNIQQPLLNRFFLLMTKDFTLLEVAPALAVPFLLLGLGPI